MASYKKKTLSMAGILVALGIVYGDIGTSPLYVMKAIVGSNGGYQHVSPTLILGAISLIFWSVTLLTTIKYVVIALRADNKGEGGIFALYTLVRRRAKWLIIPALVGGAALLADGVLTPAVTVTSAIEGLKGVHFGSFTPPTNQGALIIAILVILSCLFFFQHFGTSAIGKAFGPLMFVWFTFLGVVGVINILPDLSILRAFNPVYAVQVLFSPSNNAGVFILGSVFLATTGAEALYSDLGHVGLLNIRASWPYVFVCLMLNYLGQGVYILHNAPRLLQATGEATINPFFELLPGGWRLVGILLATFAAIIASQALITGSYTLVAEAIRLKFLPRVKINYPTVERGQIYIPAINTILWLGCMGVVLFFRSSERMEAAYGLAITVTMLMTTLLLYQFLRSRKTPLPACLAMAIFFIIIEGAFFLSSLQKFVHGGYVTIIIAGAILGIMCVWYYGNIVRDRDDYSAGTVDLRKYLQQLVHLSNDDHYPVYTTNLVCMAKVKRGYRVKREFLKSILDKRPKRARIYWFITVNVTDEPYTQEYSVDMMGTQNVVNVQLFLGFRRSQRIYGYLRQIIKEMVARGELSSQPRRYSTTPRRLIGDFRFLIIHEDLSPEADLPSFDKAIITARLWLQKHTGSPATWFGLEFASVTNERVPLLLGKPERLILKYRDTKK